jgi:hypothetical protein
MEDVDIKIYGFQELEETMKKLNDAVEEVKHLSMTLARLGIVVEVKINDPWKNHR